MDDATPQAEIPPTGEPLLTVNGLHVVFPNPAPGGEAVNALNGVDLAVGPSEIVGLVGGSGSGKTMLCLSILGLIDRPGRITSGQVLWRGRDLTRIGEDELRRVRGRQIAMIFQNPQAALNPVINVDRHLLALLRLHRGTEGAAAEAEASRALDRVRLPDTKRILRSYPHELSAGMCQRVMIAMALICQPRLILADEPTAALDADLSEEMGNLLAEVCREMNAAVLLVSHEVGLVQALCQRVYSMVQGRIVRSEVLRTPEAKPPALTMRPNS